MTARSTRPCCAEEAVRLGGGAAGLVRKAQQQEIADARDDLDAELADRLGEPGQPAGVVLDRGLGVGDILHGRDAGLERRTVDVEGSPDAVQGVADRRRAIAPADAQRREAIDLGEGPGHHDVLGRGGELQAGGIIVAPHIFGIGGVEHQKHVRRQGRMQPLDLGEGQVGAGRVVGIGQEHGPGFRADHGKDVVDIGREVHLLGLDRGAAGRLDGDARDQEAVRRDDALVARADEGMGQQRQDVVRSAAAHDPRRIEPVAVRDGGAQPRGRAVRVEIEAARRGPKGLDGLGGGAERRLVGGQLEGLDAPPRRRFCPAHRPRCRGCRGAARVGRGGGLTSR